MRHAENAEYKYIEEVRNAMRARIQLISLDRVIQVKQYIPSEAPLAHELMHQDLDHLSEFRNSIEYKYGAVEDVKRSIIKPEEQDRRKLRFGIWNNDQLVGNIVLTPSDAISTTGYIDYYLGNDFEGKGYATKAVETLTTYAFDHLGYRELIGFVHRDNVASANVLLRAGYVQDEESFEIDYVGFARQKKSNA